MLGRLGRLLVARRSPTARPEVRATLLDDLYESREKFRGYYGDSDVGLAMDDYFLRKIERIERGTPVVLQYWELPREVRPSWLRSDGEVCFEPDGSFAPVRRTYPAPHEVRFVRPDGTEVR